MSKIQKPAPSPTERLGYTMAEFCSVARLSRQTVYSLMAKGELKTVKVGGRRMIPADAARALFEAA